MAWTTPKTWVSEVLTSNDMNTYLSDNTQYLYDELTASVIKEVFSDTATEYSSTSTTAVAIDSNDLSITLDLSGDKDVLITFMGMIRATAACTIYTELEVGGVTYSTIDNTMSSSGSRENFSYVLIISGLGAGSTTFRPLWSNSQGTTITLGLSNRIKQFTVREIDT